MPVAPQLFPNSSVTALRLCHLLFKKRRSFLAVSTLLQVQ